uniref:Preprotein translocase SecG subunit n=1 Tax=Catenella fusiformis TaxID=3024791 RepID=UPI0027D9E663|nr:Preprotein translocase SecG subunit [Catenella fusiformis]WCH57544.1 Preprotein translocase SecG subunit [Catenella fusiformis]
MRLIWYLVAMITVFLILVNHPKVNNLKNLGSQINILNSTRRTQQSLQFIIALNVFMFLFLTVLSVLFLYT